MNGEMRLVNAVRRREKLKEDGEKEIWYERVISDRTEGLQILLYLGRIITSSGRGMERTVYTESESIEISLQRKICKVL